MKRLATYLVLSAISAILLSSGCNERRRTRANLHKPMSAQADSGFVLIAADINYDVIVAPPKEADPWESERVSGYDGNMMLEDIFEKIYAGTLAAYDLLTGESLRPSEVGKMVKEMKSSGSGVAKIQFTEDWYYNSATGELKKIVKSIILGYEFRDSQGTFFGHRALFRVIMAE